MGPTDAYRGMITYAPFIAMVVAALAVVVVVAAVVVMRTRASTRGYRQFSTL